VNVARQRREDGSLLNWFERLIRRQRECPELGFGSLEILDAGAPSVLAHRCDWDDSTIVAVHELAGEAATVALALDGPDDTDALVDLFSADLQALDSGTVQLELEPTASDGCASGARDGGCRPSRRRVRPGDG
jgi:hypothetical protein